MSSICPVFNDAGEQSSPFNKPNHLSIISKLFEAKVVENINTNNLLSDEQDGVRTTADVQTTLTHRISQVLDDKNTLKNISDISNVFGKA